MNIINHLAQRAQVLPFRPFGSPYGRVRAREALRIIFLED